ncbi:MAG: hypothetical protein IPM02_27675 [Betaproteobacteria bacterium]|nr:hypothetical protein [Betaproteobacteria bacterium]
MSSLHLGEGRQVKWVADLAPPETSAAIPSGCAIDNGRASSLLRLATPSSLSAHICSSVACIETLTAGSGSLSFR